MKKELLQKIDDAIAAGIDHIAAAQIDDGSFASMSAPDKRDLSGGRIHHTTFFAANILACLNGSADVRFDAVREKAARFLSSQKSDAWSFNYWARGAEERTTMPYPDDLDDTFAALAALQGFDRGIVNGGSLAGIVKLLTSVEVKEGGPYRTWLVPDAAAEAWKDVDLVVNANVGHFLSYFFDVSLPGLTAFIDEEVRAGRMRSQYYPDSVGVLYFISRSYGGNERATIADALFAAQSDSGGLWENTLASAMAIAALINIGKTESITEAMVFSFLDDIRHEGWRPEPFCIDPSREGKAHYAGSSALTAAFCVQALARYRDSLAAAGRRAEEKGSSREADIVWKRTAALAHASTLPLPANLKEYADRLIDDTTDKEIAMVPYVMRAAAGKRCTVAEATLDRLAVANNYGWIAYTIYDDFLDEEGDPLSLSAANFFLRQLTAEYIALDKQIPGLAAYYKKIMDAIDAANLWELQHCRVSIKNGTFAIPPELPFLSLDALADRSLGHALPAVGVLLAMGYAPDSAEIKTLISFFRNYLIARQLHDDAHDWSEDLLRGQINAAGAKLLRKWRERENAAPDRTIDVADAMQDLRKLFWHEVIDEVVEDIRTFTKRARNDLHSLDWLEHPEVLVALIERLEASADRTLRERRAAVEFLSHY